MVRIGINGFGIIGRYSLRAIQKEIDEGKLREGEVEVVAVNDIAIKDSFTVEDLAQLLKHDSVYLGFPGRLEVRGKNLLVNGRQIAVSSERDPSNLHWEDLGVDVVYESTGAFVKKPKTAEAKTQEALRILERYLETRAGAKKIIFSAPSDIAEITIVMGVNDKDYNGQNIVSNASCTTNCLAPLALALLNEFGTYSGLMTTIHAYTADQRLVDSPHSDIARAYAAGLNLIPTSTGAAKAIGKVIPQLAGKLNGLSVRVPVASGSLVDLVVNLSRDVTAEEVNAALKEAAAGYLEGVLEYREGPVVSSMALGSPVPCIVDGKQIMAIKDERLPNGAMVKVLAYYDNVSGYSHQAVKLIRMVGEK